MTRQCLCAPTGNARSHNSIFLNAFEAQNLFQNDLDNGGVWVVILVECSGGETPGAHVADAVALVVKSGEGQPEAKDDRKQKSRTNSFTGYLHRFSKNNTLFYSTLSRLSFSQYFLLKIYLDTNKYE